MAVLTPDQVAAIVREHSSFVWRTLRRFGVESDGLEDASQEVFIVVLRRFGAFEGRSSVRTWLFAIARRVALRTHRRQRRQTEVLGCELDDGTLAPYVESKPELREILRRIEQRLATLDEDKRNVFVLFELEGFSMQEVADAVGCPTSTAYARLYAARGHIEQGLEQHAGAELRFQRQAIPGVRR